MKGIQGEQALTNHSIGVEAVVAWLGVRMASCCGIRMAQEDRCKLSHIIQQRMGILSIQDPILYFQLVDSQSDGGIAEWEQLVALFMNGETFFFRDSGQFSVLKKHILPAIIQRRETTRVLRIWSAGCSTGEEAYSLALLVDQLLPDRKDWDISIVGTDINVRSIQQARKGVYGQWAFRMVDTEIRDQYFCKTGNQWVLNESIRNMVTFRQSNIVVDAFPALALGIKDLDLIVCRNVFLYFHDDAMGQVVQKMVEALANDGYLLTGHGELHTQATKSLQAKYFPDSVVYQPAQTMYALFPG